MLNQIIGVVLSSCLLTTYGEAGYAATFKDRVYSPLLHHARAKFLNGSSLGLAERSEVDFAWKMMPQVQAKVGAVPGLIAGIIEYGN